MVPQLCLFLEYTWYLCSQPEEQGGYLSIKVFNSILLSSSLPSFLQQPLAPKHCPRNLQWQYSALPHPNQVSKACTVMTNEQLKLSHQGTREDTFLSHLVLIGLESQTCGHFMFGYPGPFWHRLKHSSTKHSLTPPSASLFPLHPRL